MRQLLEEMGDDGLDSDKGANAFRRLTKIVERSGVTFVLHAHAATRTMEDATQNLPFDVTRIVKTVAFRTRNGGLVLAALRGTGRVDSGAWQRLAALATGRCRRSHR